MKSQLLSLSLGLAFAFITASSQWASAADSEQALLSVLASNASAAEKGIACKKLAVFGTDRAVPALAPLLANPELASWARIGLEAIPGPVADKALRDQFDKLQGRLLVGVINSVGRRGDEQAVEALGKKLAATDREVAEAAAHALGSIGGDRAADYLLQVLAEGGSTIRSAAAHGLILAAEQYLNAGNNSAAAKLYASVRESKVAKQRQLEATRGLILASQEDGIPLLVEQLRSDDKGFFGIGLRTARELPGSAATEALAAEFQTAAPEKQSMILLALADRQDSRALPTITAAAKSGSKPVRLAALSVLDKQGTAATIPVLLAAAGDPTPEVAQSARSSLIRLQGNGVDTELVKRLEKAQGKDRQVLLDLAGQRQIKESVPIVLASTRDNDPKVRAAAIQSLGILGTESEASELVKLIGKTSAEQERGDMKTALLAIAGRTGPKSAPILNTLARSDDPALRVIGLHALAAAGGPSSLATVVSATKDEQESVRDEAVRTLSTWPNTWPDDDAVAEPLLALAQSAGKTSHQVLAVRGFLQYVQGDKGLKGEEKLQKISEILPSIKRPEEKRMAISAVTGTRSPGMLSMLATLANDSAITEEACSAIVSDSVLRTKGLSKEELRKALETVKQKSNNDATKRKAEQALGQMS